MKLKLIEVDEVGMIYNPLFDLNHSQKGGALLDYIFYLSSMRSLTRETT